MGATESSLQSPTPTPASTPEKPRSQKRIHVISYKPPGGFINEIKLENFRIFSSRHPCDGTLVSLDLFNSVGALEISLRVVADEIKVTGYQRGINVFECVARIRDILWLLDLYQLAKRDEDEFMKRYEQVIDLWEEKVFTGENFEEFCRSIGDPANYGCPPPEYKEETSPTE